MPLHRGAGAASYGPAICRLPIRWARGSRTHPRTCLQQDGSSSQRGQIKNAQRLGVSALGMRKGWTEGPLGRRCVKVSIVRPSICMCGHQGPSIHVHPECCPDNKHQHRERLRAVAPRAGGRHQIRQGEEHEVQGEKRVEPNPCRPPASPPGCPGIPGRRAPVRSEFDNLPRLRRGGINNGHPLLGRSVAAHRGFPTPCLPGST